MAVKQYTKRPVTIEAIQFIEENYKACLDFCPTLTPPIGGSHALTIPTLEGNMIVSFGDFIIKGIKGEFYPCKPDIFWGSYIEQIKD